MTPETITLEMKIGMGISGIMLVAGIIATVLVSFAAVLLCFESTRKIKSMEQYFHFISTIFLLAGTAALLFLGSIAVKIHMWMRFTG